MITRTSLTPGEVDEIILALQDRRSSLATHRFVNAGTARAVESRIVRIDRIISTLEKARKDQV